MEVEDDAQARATVMRHAEMAELLLGQLGETQIDLGMLDTDGFRALFSLSESVFEVQGVYEIQIRATPHVTVIARHQGKLSIEDGAAILIADLEAHLARRV